MTIRNEVETFAHSRPCRTPDELHAWLRQHAGLHVPRNSVCPNHQAPFDYVCASYFEPSPDLIVWAPRGGGKTRLAAAVTFAELLHKPGISIRILGGSLEQSLRMWEHLLPCLEEHAPDMILRRPRSARRIALCNDSAAAVLTQSERAVRGLRVNKLRCDEVELFKPEIWEAAQLVTRSGEGPGGMIAGTVQAISTFHRPYGLMSRIIDDAPAAGKRLVHWCLLEVLERCPPQRDCRTCPLWDECRGLAKDKCDGFFRIDDAIAMKRRVSRETWESEILCRRPSTRGCVFPSFDRAVHVSNAIAPSAQARLSLAIDFGFHNPFVCLWIFEQPDSRRLIVVDEYVQQQQTIDVHLAQIEARNASIGRRPNRIACDPAGSARNEQTAESNVSFLRRHGYSVCTRRSLIVEGVEMIRAALRPACGEPTLIIHPRCQRLIRALEQYRYAPDSRGGELPLKDGVHDHLIDALRYFFVNREHRRSITARHY